MVQYINFIIICTLIDVCNTGLAGNLGSIYASRISTCLHRGVQEQFKIVESTLLLMNIPVQILFLFIAWFLDIGHLDFTFAFALTYFIVSMICVSFCDYKPCFACIYIVILQTFTALKMGKSMTLGFWKYKYDPDNYVLPYL